MLECNFIFVVHVVSGVYVAVVIVHFLVIDVVSVVVDDVFALVVSFFAVIVVALNSLVLVDVLVLSAFVCVVGVHHGR